MSPSSGSDDDREPKFLVCASCGSKAQPSWSFCRSCNSSLEDAKEAQDEIRTADAPDLGPTGCPKCGHDDADVAQIATTGAGVTAWFDL